MKAKRFTAYTCAPKRTHTLCPNCQWARVVLAAEAEDEIAALETQLQCAGRLYVEKCVELEAAAPERDAADVALRGAAEAHDVLADELGTAKAERDEARAALAEAKLIESDRAALAASSGDTYPQPRDGWTCFHCGVKIRSYIVAKEHFGETPSENASLRAELAALEAECKRAERAMRLLAIVEYEASNDSKTWLSNIHHDCRRLLARLDAEAKT